MFPMWQNLQTSLCAKTSYIWNIYDIRHQLSSVNNINSSFKSLKVAAFSQLNGEIQTIKCILIWRLLSPFRWLKYYWLAHVWVWEGVCNSVSAVYPGLVLLLLLVQLSLVHTGSVQVEPQGLSYPRQERGEQRGHVCQTRWTTNLC